MSLTYTEDDAKTLMEAYLKHEPLDFKYSRLRRRYVPVEYTKKMLAEDLVTITTCWDYKEEQ